MASEGVRPHAAAPSCGSPSDALQRSSSAPSRCCSTPGSATRSRRLEGGSFPLADPRTERGEALIRRLPGHVRRSLADASSGIGKRLPDQMVSRGRGSV